MNNYRHALFVLIVLLVGACSEQASNEHLLQEKTDAMKKAEAAAAQLEQATTDSLKQIEGGE